MNSQDNAGSRRWIQFSLHTLMALIVAACVAVAWFTQVPFVDISIDDIRVFQGDRRIEYLCTIRSRGRGARGCRLFDEDGKLVSALHLTDAAIRGDGDQRKLVIYVNAGTRWPYLPDPMFTSPIGFDPSWRNPVPTLAKGATYRITDDHRLKAVRFMGYDGKPVYFFLELYRED